MALPHVNAGELITSAAWNKMVDEFNTKLNKAGDTMTGRLTIPGANWDPLSTEGDLKIGDNTNWFKIGVATGGGGAGHVRLYQGGTNKVMFIGTGNNNELTLANGNVGVGTTNPQAKLHVNGAIHAGTSEIYFTNIAHNHTGFGNTQGFAAIENSANYNALMILGRKVGPSRMVQLWDNVEIPGGNLSFGAATRQMINMWNAEYGIGVQSGTTYFRTGAHFGWHRGGVHNDAQLNPGAGGTRIMYLDTSGNLVLEHGSGFKPGGGPWAAVSDKKLKKNIKNIEGALDKLTKLRGVTFDWKDESTMGTRGKQIGMIAQEVEEVFPEWIVNDPNDNKGIAFSGFEAMVVESLKELKAEIAKIKEQLK